MADLPGGASGLLVLDYRGKDADWLVTRTAPGVVSLVAELLPRARQTAEELGQGKTRGEERKVIDASQAAGALALEKRALELYPYLSQQGNALT